MDKEQRMLDARIMQAQGMKQWEIAEQLGVTERTVRNYLRYPPRPRKKPKRRSLLDPFMSFVDVLLAEFAGPMITEQSIELGWADESHFRKTEAALKKWSKHAGAFFAHTFCEAVGWKK